MYRPCHPHMGALVNADPTDAGALSQGPLGLDSSHQNATWISSILLLGFALMVPRGAEIWQDVDHVHPRRESGHHAKDYGPGDWQDDAVADQQVALQNDLAFVGLV